MKWYEKINKAIYPPKEFYNKSWKYYFIYVLLIMILGLILYAFVDGQFIKKEVHIVEICQGYPKSLNDDFVKEIYKNSLGVTHYNITIENMTS